MVPCAASTCGAKVKGTSLRSSAVSELFSGVWPAWLPVSGLDTVTLDVSSLLVSEDWLPSASEVCISLHLLYLLRGQIHRLPVPAQRAFWILQAFGRSET